MVADTRKITYVMFDLTGAYGVYVRECIKFDNSYTESSVHTGHVSVWLVFSKKISDRQWEDDQMSHC